GRAARRAFGRAGEAVRGVPGRRPPVLPAAPMSAPTRPPQPGARPGSPGSPGSSGAPGSPGSSGFREPVGRCLGLDVGTRTIGVAVSDPLGLTAQPLEVIRYRSWQEAEERLEALVRQYGPERLVVGYPRRTDGTEGPEARWVRKKAARLRARLGLPCDLWDERLTTAAAERALLEADVSRRRRREV